MSNQWLKSTGLIKTYPEVVNIKDGIEFFRMYLEVPRKSGVVDILPVGFSANSKVFEMLSEWEASGKDIVGLYVTIFGEVRTRNKKVEGKSKLEVSIFANNIVLEDKKTICNVIKLEGYVVKKIPIRDTPRGLKIVDTIIAVHRKEYSDYIPTIFFNVLAEEIHEKWNVGDKIQLKGRMQSRDYNKEVGTDAEGNPVYEVRTCYELAVLNVENTEVLDKN